ncbi:MAG: hypothetical protein IJA47_03815 [Oscillospiraceae bacterium]|nr:hypothetical protein [Oscillospiraceae bacterium]
MRRVIYLILVFALCLGLCACAPKTDWATAVDKAEQILEKAAENSQADILISCRMNEKNTTLIVGGKLSTYLQGAIDAAKKDASIPSWLKEGVIEELKNEQLQEDASAKEFFLDLAYSEISEQVQACFENANIVIIYQYEDINGLSTSREYDE